MEPSKFSLANIAEKMRLREEALDEEFGKDRNETYRKFVVTEGMQRAVDKWLRETVYPDAIARQRGHFKKPDRFIQDCWNSGFPYEGAVGGGLTYSFTDTSIGTIVTARYGNDYKLDLSDHSDFG